MAGGKTGQIHLWRIFEKWSAPRAKATAQELSDVDTVLRNLKPDKNLTGVLLASVTQGEHSFELRIDPDDRPVEECIQLARELLFSFQETNKKALSTASDSLLETYNYNWREYSEMGKDGRLEDVSKPELNSLDFEAIIKISTVSIIGPMVEFLYSDNGLFTGHSIVVTSFDGLKFSDTNAELFG